MRKHLFNSPHPMKALRFVYTMLFVIGFINPLAGQDTLFYENFDSSPGSKPFGWTTELEAGDSKWEFVDGGGTKNPEIPGSRRPSSAYSGTVNALYFFESLEGEEVILVTPPVNLEFAIRPELRFMHVQREGNLGFGAAHDELRIYYKTHFDSAWTEIRKIAEFTDEVYDWTEQIVQLPGEAFVPECYFAFRAKTNYGWGVGIDDVKVIETEIQLREVEAVDIFQEDTGILPTGSKNNPILRINVSVKGNSGTVSLNSLDLTSLNTSDDDIETNGVKLYYNYINRNFFAATLLDSITFVSGEAVFSALDLDLSSGHTSLWVTYDIKADASHYNLADAMLAAGSISINGGPFPGSSVSPAGNRVIQEAIFYDDFSTDKNWVLEGDFERDRPRGLGGNFLGNPDPIFASGDTMVLGNDLTGLGSNMGDYEASINKYTNLAETPVSNLFYYNEIQMNFLRWLNVANNDTASIEMSLDNGNSWSEVWSNDNNVFTDGEWKPFSLNLSGASRNSQVQVRFNLGPTTATDHLSGWNIENFSITGNYVEYDVGPVALLSPVTGCGHSSAETVRIRVKNFGPGATPDKIPVRYSVDGGSTFTDDILNGVIALEGQVDFDFTDVVDLTTPGVYNVVLETALGVDEDSTNNRFDTVIYVDPTYSLPYIQDFETGSDFWRVEGVNPTFEFGAPMGSIIHTTASGVNAWVTNLDGEYANNEDSYLIGPCFDFTGVDYPVFECKLYLSSESANDGTQIEYSLNNGQTWSRLGNLGDGDSYDWNWYNSQTISSLTGGHGWTGNTDDWQTSRIELDTMVFRNQPSVKFRFHFASDASGRLEGIGIDDIRIYEVPRDVGVLSIESPINGCVQEIGDHVSVTIMNYGIDTLMVGDTLIAGYQIESEPVVIDTFVLESNLLSGSSAPFVFSKPLEVLTVGWLDIEAYTLLVDDIDFYNTKTANDTASKSFEVAQTPIVLLPTHIYSVRPDTIVLDANTGYAGDTYLWQDGSTDPLYQVTAMADGIYHVTASNTYCSFSDTAYVYRLIADVGVTDILEPVTGCELGATVMPRIELKNFGTDTLQIGDEIPVRYQIDADAVIEETAVVTVEVLPDSVFEYLFSTASDMSEIKTYSISSFTDLDFDDARTNDTTNVSIEVYGYTPIYLGSDTVVRAFEYTIDAGVGYDTYQWQDGSNQQTLVIDTTGLYRVMVQTGSMCANSDSVLVTMLIPDIGVTSLSNPTDGCSFSDSEHVEFYILNSGTDTLQSNDTLFITYQFDGGSLVYDSLIVDKQVVPGDSILFSSSGTVDVESTTSYQFSVDVAYSKDLIPGNNLFDQTIEVFIPPTVSLGDDLVVNTARYTLDAGVGFIYYLWQDGSSGQQFVAEHANQTTDSIYMVVVTDEHGCEASDDIKIGFDLWDVGVSSIQSPVSGCILTDQEELSLHVKNFGMHAIDNEPISVTVSVDHKTPVTVLRTLTQVLNPGDSVQFIVGFTFDLSAKGDHSVTAYSIYGQDADPYTDTLDVIITHLGLPAPELGGVNDTLGTQLPYTLDAGAGFAAYLWNGDAGEQTYDAARFGWYNLEVIDPDGCFGKDSIYLTSMTAIEDLLLPGDLKVYPVPASRYLHVEYSYAKTENLILDLFDSNGRIVFNRQFTNVKEFTETIDVGDIARGMYYLRLRSDEQELTKLITLF